MYSLRIVITWLSLFLCHVLLRGQVIIYLQMLVNISLDFINEIFKI